MINQKGPRIEKNCSWCCDPVKVHRRTNIPKDNLGQELWQKTNEIRVPEKHIDTVRLEVYKCLWYDKNYDNRPKICRNTSCIQDNSEKTIDQQHKDPTDQDFIKITKK